MNTCSTRSCAYRALIQQLQYRCVHVGRGCPYLCGARNSQVISITDAVLSRDCRSVSTTYNTYTCTKNISSGIAEDIVYTTWVVDGRDEFNQTLFSVPEFIGHGILIADNHAVTKATTFQCTLVLESGRNVVSDVYHQATDGVCPNPTPVITPSTVITHFDEILPATSPTSHSDSTTNEVIMSQDQVLAFLQHLTVPLMKLLSRDQVLAFLQHLTIPPDLVMELLPRLTIMSLQSQNQVQWNPSYSVTRYFQGTIFLRMALQLQFHRNKFLTFILRV